MIGLSIHVNYYHEMNYYYEIVTFNRVLIVSS